MFAELAIAMSDATVWLSIGQGLLFGGACLLFGIWVARLVGLLPSDAPAGETLGVGLASGLMVLAAWWAALASGGRSSFTPVAVGFAIAVALALVRRARPNADPMPISTAPPEIASNTPAARSPRRRNLLVAVLAGAVLIVALALIFGSTLTLRPRDGMQPIEFQDVAFYSVLGADLAKTGTETIYSPSGFAQLEGLPVQTWYHWGEMWLASAAITVFAMAPLDARHFVVLPLLLLTAAALTGTLVRRVTGSASQGAFLFGFLACLFLAPMPLFPGQYFNLWHVSLIFGITAYGLAAVAVLLALYCLAGLGDRQATWALAAFVGSAAALILPAHIAIAVLALVGVGSVWTLRIVQSLAVTRRLPVVAPVWRRTFTVTGIAIVATVAWGLLTGHGFGGSGLSPNVSPFNAAWREAIATTILGAGVFLAIAVAWLMVRKSASIEADLYLGTAALLVIGGLVWGLRVADFNMFHLSTAGIAVFATPAAAVAVGSIWLRLRRTGHARLGGVVLVLCVLQLEYGAAVGIVRLQGFGTREYAPVPLAILEAIRSLPREAKLAYACRTSDEIAFWDAQLLGLDARTGRRIVPMCFQADFFGQAMGDQASANIASPLFRWAPQRRLYPDPSADPSSASVAAFLKENGIDYIYVDPKHPNSLVPGAVPISTSGQTQVLRLP